MQDQVVNDVKSIYLAARDILQEPNDIESCQKINDTLEEVHMVKHVFSEDSVFKLKFFKIATDEKPFYQHWYQCKDDPEVCNHAVLRLSFNQNNTCARCKAFYLGKEDWLK